MQSAERDQKAITIRVPNDLRERFKLAAEAEHRTMAGSLLNFMEERVAEHEGAILASGKAA